MPTVFTVALALFFLLMVHPLKRPVTMPLEQVSVPLGIPTMPEAQASGLHVVPDDINDPQLVA